VSWWRWLHGGERANGGANHPTDDADPPAYDLWASTIKRTMGRDSVHLLLTSEPAHREMIADRRGAAGAPWRPPGHPG
jgi:hypothetical protein